jgi:uncharacterized membrane protein YhdT
MKNTLGPIVYAWFRVESLDPSRFIAIYYLLLLRFLVHDLELEDTDVDEDI